MAVTLKDLASELGLSPATVSLALRNSPLVAKTTRHKVQILAEKRDYVQSYLGRALQSRKTQLIGFLIPNVTASFYNELLQGAGTAATEAGYGLLLGWTAPADSNNGHQIRLMLEKDVDALVITDHSGCFDNKIPGFLKRGKPVVYCTGEAQPGCSAVLNDDFLGGQLAMRVLAEHGHRKVLCSCIWAQRLAGNRDEAARQGVEVIEYYGAGEAVDKLSADRKITAVAAYSDEEAIELLGICRSKGIRVPEDVSLIGFDDLPVCSLPEFRLSTVAQERSLLGQRALELAIRQLEKPGTKPSRELLKPSLVLRNTVRKI